MEIYAVSSVSTSGRSLLAQFRVGILPLKLANGLEYNVILNLNKEFAIYVIPRLEMKYILHVLAKLLITYETKTITSMIQTSRNSIYW